MIGNIRTSTCFQVKYTFHSGFFLCFAEHCNLGTPFLHNLSPLPSLEGKVTGCVMHLHDHIGLLS